MTKKNRITDNQLILIVDDDDILRQILCLSMSQAGFDVAEAVDGEDALEKFEELNPDAILLDILMPKLNGFDVCERIRKMPGGNSLPIILITGQDDYESINKSFESGATDFASKPLNPLLLGYRLRYILRASKAIGDLDLSEIKLAAVQEMAKLSNWELDLTDNSVNWSQSVCQILGRKNKSFKGDCKAFYDIIHQDDLEFVKERIDEAISNNKDFNFEHKIICEDGTVKNLKQDGKILADNSGTPVRIIFSSKDITHKRNTENEVKFLAYYDRLTKLPNRLLFKEHFNKALVDAKRDNSFLAVLFIDIDNFRLINDTFSRKIGDDILSLIAERLKICIRDNDTTAKLDEYDLTARFGADEFGIILEGLNDLSDAAIVARRVIESLNEMISIDDKEIFLHSRVGVSVFPDDGDSVDELMRNAGAALSRVKELEKDSYQFFTADLNSKAFARYAMETSMRKAIENEEFSLLYQPQVDLQSGKVAGVEALIRWHHPEMGVVSPMEFIPIAEDTGLIIPIGAWVISTACKQCKEWSDNDYGIRMSINLSAGQFQDKKLIEQIRNVISSTEVDPSLLEFEITESMLMDNVEASINQMDKLKNLGVRLSIDDFGTGYSSLNYLKRFPVNALKVDRSFVSDITTSDDDAMIVKAVVTLAQNLQLEVIAEGIEISEHLDFLNHLGCNLAQGYLISRPAPEEEVVNFFGDWSVDDIDYE